VCKLRREIFAHHCRSVAAEILAGRNVHAFSRASGAGIILTTDVGRHRALFVGNKDWPDCGGDSSQQLGKILGRNC